VVIEDSPFGVRAGVAAGMRVLGYGGGLAAPGLLAEAGAEVFGRMSEVPALLGV
jgi:beta-phosphoglucomutase-like phosphatase (HAD superfamily)